mmetsp:Transcript_81088/g.164236  ORF Transcript_81088/g.164236 Transcript_81088/m.164236 type:complete len:249 (+) Transcript_81088:1490-2236(+)
MRWLDIFCFWFCLALGVLFLVLFDTAPRHDDMVQRREQSKRRPRQFKDEFLSQCLVVVVPGIVVRGSSSRRVVNLQSGNHDKNNRPRGSGYREQVYGQEREATGVIDKKGSGDGGVTGVKDDPYKTIDVVVLHGCRKGKQGKKGQADQADRKGSERERTTRTRGSGFLGCLVGRRRRFQRFWCAGGWWCGARAVVPEPIGCVRALHFVCFVVRFFVCSASEDRSQMCLCMWVAVQGKCRVGHRVVIFV